MNADDLKPTPTDSDEPLDDLGPETVVAFAQLFSTAPPPELRRNTLAHALSRRLAGTPISPAPDDTRSPAEGYRRTAAEITQLTGTIRAEEWSVPTVHGWTVKDTVAHLATVESWFGSKIGALAFESNGSGERDHLATTREGMAALAASSPSEVAQVFHERSEHVADALDALPPAEWDVNFAFYAFDAPLSANVIARMFEQWIHHEDIRRALGRPLVDLDPGRFRLMTSVAAAALPAGIALAGFTLPGKTARLVLTGPGGGTFVRELSGAEPITADRPDVTLIADAIEFCRVAARRLGVDDLDVVIEGDRDLAHKVLVGVSMLAAD